MERSTALYYFLSTVAQSFATAVALLGAVALYRMQSLNNEVDKASRFLIDNYHKNSDDLAHLLELYLAGRHSDILGHYNSGPGRRDSGADSKYYAALTSLRLGCRVKVDVRHHLSNSLGITSALVLVSIALIPLVPVIATSQIATLGLVLLVLFGVVKCFRKYALLARAALS